MPEESKLTTGWGNPRPYDSKSKFHYYAEDGISLCHKWGRLGGLPEVEEGNDNHEANCAACKKKIAAYRKSKEQEDAINV